MHVVLNKNLMDEKPLRLDFFATEIYLMKRGRNSELASLYGKQELSWLQPMWDTWRSTQFTTLIVMPR